MSGRRGRGKAKDSPARGRGRGRGRGKAQTNNEPVEESPVSAPVVSESVDACSSVSDKAAPNHELDTVNETKISDSVETCTSLQASDSGGLPCIKETEETKLESKEPEVKTEKTDDVINIDADAVILTVNVSDGSLEPTSNEPEVIELDSDSDDDDGPAKVNEEKELISSNVDSKESVEFEVSANERNFCDARDVINLDDDDDDDDDVTNTAKDEQHFYCAVCDINCKTKQGFRNHEQGFYHCQRVEKANEDKTVEGIGEEEQGGVGAAAAAVESNQENNEEAMEIEMAASATETVEQVDETSREWIMLDQVDEAEGSDVGEDKDLAVTRESMSAVEDREQVEMLMCDAFGVDKDEASGDGDKKTKDEVQEGDHSVKDDGECSDNANMEKQVVADKGSKDADKNALEKTGEAATTDKEAIEDVCEIVGKIDEENGKCDAAEFRCDIQNKELSESEFELMENRDQTVNGPEQISATKRIDVKKEVEGAEPKVADMLNELEQFNATNRIDIKKEVEGAESKDADVTELKEQHESIETEEAGTTDDSKETGDGVIDPYYCAACDVRCESDKAYHMHTRGVMHTLNCGSFSSAAERPKPVPQVYRVPERLKVKAKKSGTKKPKESKAIGEGTDTDVILIDDDEEEDDVEEVEEVEESNSSKEYNWLDDIPYDTFYCEVCDCSMTSEQNYESHLIGARHKKNLKNLEIGVPVKKPKGKVAVVGHGARVVDREPKAQEMINNCKDALIGLHYMTEFCHSSPDVEPRYVCNLCEAKCDVRMVIIHLTGLKHRMNYLKKYHINYAVLVQQRVRKSDQTPLAEQFAKEIEALEGRRKMVVKMDMGGDAASGSVSKETKEELEVASRRGLCKRRASFEHSKSPSGRMSPVDARSLSPGDEQKSDEKPVYISRKRLTESRERRHSRSDNRCHDRSPRRWSSRQRTRSRSHSRDKRSSRDRYPYRKDYDRESWRDRRYGERDQRDRDPRRSSPERRRRSDYNRYEQDSRTGQSVLQAALYACGTNYPYAQAAGVALNPYALMSPSAFPVNSTYSAALSSTYTMTRRAMDIAPPAAKRGRFSAADVASASMSYASPNLLNPYGSLGAASPYASLYGARSGGLAPQVVPPAPESSLLSRASTGYQRSSGGSKTYGTKLGSGAGSLSSQTGSFGDDFSALSSIVANVSTGVARDDDEAAAMSKVIAEAVIKYKMQKAQEKTRQQPPVDRFQKRY